MEWESRKEDALHSAFWNKAATFSAALNLCDFRPDEQWARSRQFYSLCHSSGQSQETLWSMGLGVFFPLETFGGAKWLYLLRPSKRTVMRHSDGLWLRDWWQTAWLQSVQPLCFCQRKLLEHFFKATKANKQKLWLTSSQASNIFILHCKYSPCK